MKTADTLIKRVFFKTKKVSFSMNLLPGRLTRALNLTTRIFLFPIRVWMGPLLRRAVVYSGHEDNDGIFYGHFYSGYKKAEDDGYGHKRKC